MNDEGLVFGKDRLVIGALRIDPEFEHAAWRVQGSWDAAFALDFARIADIDDNHVLSIAHLDGLFRRHVGDARLRLRHELLVACGNVLWHGFSASGGTELTPIMGFGQENRAMSEDYSHKDA